MAYWKFTGLNRTTTLESLIGAVALMYVDNEEAFIAAYQLAMHDERQGKGTWEKIKRAEEKEK